MTQRFFQGLHRRFFNEAVLMRYPTYALLLFATVTAAAPAVPLVAQDTVVSEISRLKEVWISAQLNRDSSAFGRLLSDDFLFVGPDGSLMTKTQVLNGIASDRSQRSSEVGSEYKVQVHGNVAVLHGVVTITFVSGSGGTQDARLRFTDTWMKQPNGHWQCIAAQGTRMEK